MPTQPQSDSQRREPNPPSPLRQGLAVLPHSVEACHAPILAQAEQLAQLQTQVQLLQERVGLNSRNSSKPPSSDGLGSGGNRAQRRSSQR